MFLLRHLKRADGIEYTADVVLGLQLKLLADADLKLTANGNLTKDAKDKIKAEFDKTPRKLQLVCVKNRNGKSYFEVDLDYYPAFNYFVETNKNNQRY